MSFFDILVLDVILILFPIICMLLAKANIKTISNINKDNLIDIAAFTSIYLLIKYCDYSSPYSVFLVNMPFIISVLYNRKYASVLLCIILIAFYGLNGYNFYFIGFEYLLYILVFVILYKKGKKNTDFILFFIFMKGIFLTIYDFYILGHNTIFSILQIFILLIVFYLVSLLVISIVGKVEQIISLNQTLKELEKEKNLKNSLFKITHEVKNPLAVCKGYLTMMDYSDIRRVKKYHKIILSEINRTLDIMDNFSQYTKIKVNLDIMDLDSLIVDTIDSVNMLCKSKNIVINYDYNDELFINGDYDRLKQVLVNIIKNSVEAIVNNGTIDIYIKDTNKNIYLCIKDNGCGISKENLNKIDELFYSSKQKGCGIGVSLSKEILNLHNADLRYKSVLGESTEVIIKFPKNTTLH